MNLNFQAIVSQFFEWQTSVVVRWPLPFLLIPPFFTVLITSLAASDLQLNITNDTLRVFLPDDIRALRELEELMTLFPPRDALRDSYSIFGTAFAYWVYEAKSGNALDPGGLLDLARLHKAARSVTAGNLTLESVCLSSSFGPGGCSLHPFAFALEDSNPVFSAQLLLHYPLLIISNYTIDNAVVFGGVKIRNHTIDVHGNAAMDSAAAVRMIYSLVPGPNSQKWIASFLSTIPRLQQHFPNATLYMASSQSLAMEMERNGHLLIPWMPWMALILVVFCMVICSSTDPVKSQPWVGFFAMLNATLATTASTATLLYVRYPFLPLVFIMPFLVISIGTDNMFLMLKSWRMGTAKELEERFTDALTETAASLFLTSLTDGLSFSIGSVSDFYAVRVFCTYCAMAILYMFFFQITFFNALMVLCCRREIDRRHSLFCYKVPLPPVPSPSLSPSPSTTFCSLLPSLPSPSSLLCAFLRPWPARLAVFLLYLVYIVTSVNYSLALPLGLDLKLLAPDNSYVSTELALQERLFNDFGTFCFGVIKTKGINFGEPLERRRLTQLYEKMANGSSLVSGGEFWLQEFEREYAGKSMDYESFLRLLFAFLANPQNEKFKSDIRFDLSPYASYRIEAIKLILRVRAVNPVNDEPRAAFLRGAFEQGRVDGFVYDTTFLLVDQQMTTVSNVVSNVITAVITMLVISVLLVPRLASSLCVALAIISINIGVVGALSAVNTRLDIISMITIVMSVGFSVDYVVHTTFHFVTQRDNRLEKCLEVMVEPIIQSALSTAVGVALLAIVPSYIVRTFVFTVLFVVAIGVLHGLLFLPALLITVVPASEYLEPYHKHAAPATTSSAKHHVSPRRKTYKGHHKGRLQCYSPSHDEYAVPPPSTPQAPPPKSPPPPAPNMHFAGARPSKPFTGRRVTPSGDLLITVSRSSPRDLPTAHSDRPLPPTPTEERQEWEHDYAEVQECQRDQGAGRDAEDFRRNDNEYQEVQQLYHPIVKPRTTLPDYASIKKSNML